MQPAASAADLKRPGEPMPSCWAGLLACLLLISACNGGPAVEPDAGAQQSPCISGATCDDGEPCTINDTCLNNECIGTLLDCEDGNPCTTDECNNAARTCVHGHTNEGKTCDDGSACTSDELCEAGACSGTIKPCKDDKVCTWDGCDAKTGACINEQGDKACDDGNVCTVDACDDATGCSHSATNDGAPCPGGVCNAGVCAGGPEGMELVPAGTFWRGCNEATEADDCLPEERPQHQVQLSAFWMHRNHVSVADYRKCFDAGACTEPSATHVDMHHYNWGLKGREQHPINAVNWFQSRDYCKWIGGRLPTEAEWEMAARGSCDHNPGPDCRKAMRKYPWGSNTPTCDLAVLDPSKQGLAKGCGHDTTWEVGKKPKGNSPYGLFDMGGNAWDWVADCYDDQAYAKYKGVKAIDPGELKCDDETHRVFRGGSFYSFPIHLRSSRRDRYYPNFEYDCVSFRCAKSFTKR